MRICMAAVFDIENPRSWSGTPFNVHRALSAMEENQVSTINVTHYHTKQNIMFNTLRNTDFTASIKAHQRISKNQHSEMSKLNSALLGKHCSSKDFDAVLEFGGFFPQKGMPPYYVYTDASHDLSLYYYSQTGSLPYTFKNFKTDLDKVRHAADHTREIYQNAAGVFCMSQWLADSMVQLSGVSPDRVHTVYAGANWHDVDVTFPTKGKSIAGKKEIHLILVGVEFLGKGVDLAMEALEELNKMSDKEFYLHICGIKDPFEHSDHVINHGFTAKSDLVKLLDACDVFVLPSRFDCFGISFVEAMQFGLPCVGRKICAMPEIIDEGKNGLLISAEDNPVELAQCIYDIVADEEKYASFSKSALEKSAMFSWRNVSNQMMQVMRK